MPSEKVIGIDLGTTNSCVAVVESGTPVVVPNRGGYSQDVLLQVARAKGNVRREKRRKLGFRTSLGDHPNADPPQVAEYVELAEAHGSALHR